MDAVERLVAIEEIKSLKGRYQRALDAGRWDEFEGCLTEGAILPGRQLLPLDPIDTAGVLDPFCVEDL